MAIKFAKLSGKSIFCLTRLMGVPLNNAAGLSSIKTLLALRESMSLPEATLKVEA